MKKGVTEKQQFYRDFQENINCLGNFGQFWIYGVIHNWKAWKQTNVYVQSKYIFGAAIWGT